jgi:hypothetical protein
MSTAYLNAFFELVEKSTGTNIRFMLHFLPMVVFAAEAPQVSPAMVF